MKKISTPTLILIAASLIFSGCGKKTLMPSHYKVDNENFKQSVILLNKARDLSNPPESEKQSSFTLSKEVEEQIALNNKEGLKLGKLVSDDYLDFLSPEIKDMFKNKLIKGTEIYFEGLMEGKSNINSEGVKKQFEGNQLIMEWINWWSKNGESVSGKVFED